MKITSQFDEKGKTLQEIMEQFLIIFYIENINQMMWEKEQSFEY